MISHHLGTSFGNCITYPSFSSQMQIAHTLHKRLRHAICITLKREREIGQSVAGVDAPRTSFTFLCRIYLPLQLGTLWCRQNEQPFNYCTAKRPVPFVCLLHIKRDYRLIPYCESRKRFNCLTALFPALFQASILSFSLLVPEKK